MSWEPSQISGYHDYAKSYISSFSKKIDCADLAIACLIDYAETHGLHVDLKYYASKSWNWLRFPDAGLSTDEFKRKAMRMLGALNLIDNTVAIAIGAAKAGDLIMTKWSGSLGHTRIIDSITRDPKTKAYNVVWYQGNLPPVVPERKEADFSAIPSVYGQSPRRWRFAQFD
jgi:hypothetical protein